MGWICPRCGAENPYKAGTCLCCSGKSSARFRKTEQLRALKERAGLALRYKLDGAVPEDMSVTAAAAGRALRRVLAVLLILAVGLLAVHIVLRGSGAGTDLAAYVRRLSARSAYAGENLRTQASAVSRSLPDASDAKDRARALDSYTAYRELAGKARALSNVAGRRLVLRYSFLPALEEKGRQVRYGLRGVESVFTNVGSFISGKWQSLSRGVGNIWQNVKSYLLGR